MKQILIILYSSILSITCLSASFLSGSFNFEIQLLMTCSICIFFIIMLNGIFAKGGLLSTIYGFYFIVFLAFPGMLHIARNQFPFYSMHYSNDDIFSAALVLFIFALGSVIGSSAAHMARPKRIVTPPQRTQSESGVSAAGIIILILLSLAVATIVGLNSFLLSRGELVHGSVQFSELTITLRATARAIAAISLAAILHRLIVQKLSLSNFILLLGSIVLNAIINFPLAVARFGLASVAIIIVHVLIDVTKVRFKIAFTVSMFFLTWTLFPLVSFLQRGIEGTVFTFDFIRYFLESGDLDGFQSTINVVMLVERTGIRWGWQLLSALLAPVPRSMWPGKGLATGVEAASNAGYPFVNISAPFPSEILIDFGFIGVFFGAMLFCYFLAKLDYIYAFRRDRRNLRDILIFGGAAGYLLIVLRGSLLAIIAPIALHFILSFVLTSILGAHRMPAVQASGGVRMHPARPRA